MYPPTNPQSSTIHSGCVQHSAYLEQLGGGALGALVADAAAHVAHAGVGGRLVMAGGSIGLDSMAIGPVGGGDSGWGGQGAKGGEPDSAESGYRTGTVRKGRIQGGSTLGVGTPGSGSQ